MRHAVRHAGPHAGPVVASRASPLRGSRAGIAALRGQAQQRLEANGRRALHTASLLLPCLCGARPPDRVAEALPTVRGQEVPTWVSAKGGETMPVTRRRAFPRSQPHKPGTATAAPLADTG